MSTNWQLHLPRLDIRLGGGALFAVALQFIAFFAPFGDDVPRRVLFLLSYFVLLWFVAFNLRRIGILMIGVGLLLNFIVISANGGLMPVTPDVLERGDFPEDVGVGEWIPGSKDIVLERGDIRLWALSDRFLLDEGPITLAYSLGDVFLLIGLVVFVGELVIPRIRRGEPESESQNGESFA